MYFINRFNVFVVLGHGDYCRSIENKLIAFGAVPIVVWFGGRSCTPCVLCHLNEYVYSLCQDCNFLERDIMMSQMRASTSCVTFPM